MRAQRSINHRLMSHHVSSSPYHFDQACSTTVVEGRVPPCLGGPRRLIKGYWTIRRRCVISGVMTCLECLDHGHDARRVQQQFEHLHTPHLTHVTLLNLAALLRSAPSPRLFSLQSIRRHQQQWTGKPPPPQPAGRHDRVPERRGQAFSTVSPAPLAPLATAARRGQDTRRRASMRTRRMRLRRGTWILDQKVSPLRSSRAARCFSHQLSRLLPQASALASPSPKLTR